MNRPTCSKCVHFHENYKECRIRSGNFPNRQPEDWCGEHPLFMVWHMENDPQLRGQLKQLAATCKSMVAEGSDL